jgi:predicted lipid-binding transport protein (Tim44 family)
MNLPAAEPKDGDFVAYLAEIERQQMAQLPAHALAAFTSAEQATSPASPSGAAKALPATLIGKIVLGMVGLFFVLVGLGGRGGMIATAIGAFLIWRAAKSISAELRSTKHDVRELLAQKLNAVNQKRE